MSTKSQAIGLKNTANGRNLLVRWASEADEELAVAARNFFMDASSRAVGVRPAREVGGAHRTAHHAIDVGQGFRLLAAALSILGHVTHPVAQRVTVDVGTGIENIYPRRPVDVVEGDLLAVVGRVRERPPPSVTVRGMIAGREFPEALEVQTTAQGSNGRGGEVATSLYLAVAADAVADDGDRRVDYTLRVVPTDLEAEPRGACDRLNGGLYDYIEWPTATLD